MTGPRPTPERRRGGDATSPRPDLLVIAPSGDGHHGEYLRWVLDGARRHAYVSVVAAGPGSLFDHDRVRPLLTSGVRALRLPEMERALSTPSLWEQGRLTAAAIRQAVESTDATSVLLTYLDRAQLGLATGLRFTRQISGILFRPTLHEATSRALGRRLHEARKRLVLQAAAANPHLDRVFTLDPDAVGSLRARGLDAVYLPDPVEPPAPGANAEAVREQYGVEPERQLAVLFGSLEDRKGVFELLRALPHLAPESARALAVVIVGKTYDEVRPRLQQAVRAASEQTEVQVVFREAFLPDADLSSLIGASDLVVAPYQGHVGSSGVVLRAAAAGVPVLAPTTGLIGRDVARNRLGTCVDTADPSAIARGLVRGLGGEGFQAEDARAYVAAHSVDRFADVLFGQRPPLPHPT